MKWILIVLLAVSFAFVACDKGGDGDADADVSADVTTDVDEDVAEDAAVDVSEDATGDTEQTPADGDVVPDADE